MGAAAPPPPPCSHRPPFPSAPPRTGEHHVLISKADARAQGPQDPGHAARGSVPFVRGVAFDAQGRYLLAGSEDKADGLRLWDATTWKLLQSM